jgi:anthranilate/para-aminobenzoate synthase component I
VQLPADLITPCMAYLRIAKDTKYSFLLESVIAGENVARYSFIGVGVSIFQVYLTVDRYLIFGRRSIKSNQDRS